MLLKEFIERFGIKKKCFAKSVGISTTNLWKILKGITSPSLKTARKIEKVTEGKVSMQELLPGEALEKIEGQPSFEKRLSSLEERVRLLETKF